MEARKLSVCQNTLRNREFATDVDQIARAGIQGIGVSGASLELVGVAEAKRSISDAGLEVSSYFSIRGTLTADGRQPDLDEARMRLGEASQIGSPNLLVTLAKEAGLAYEEADKRAVDWLACIAAIAQQYEVQLMLEPVHPIMHQLSFIHRLGHALEITSQVESVGVVVDVGHLWWDKDFLADFRANVGAVATVQIDNVPIAALQEFRYERCRLGEGDIPLASILRSMDAAGYKGYYEIEIVMRLARDERVPLLHDSREWFEGVWNGG